MRVIGGVFGGRTLTAPRGRVTRPTPERVREAIFSILGDVGGEGVLDLFAGSGALAIEALSRGAARATLVDSAPAAIAAIRRNLTAIQSGTSDARTSTLEVEIRHQRALPFLRTARTDGRQYDLVFLDPPYSQADALGPELSGALVPVLAPGARVVVESDRRTPMKLALCAPPDERRYGDTLIDIYRALE